MLRSHLKASAAYAIGNVARSAALVLLTPYLVNKLDPQDYGVWVLFEVAILLLTMVMEAGLPVGLMREYWDVGGDSGKASLVGTVVLAVALWGFAVTAVAAGVFRAGLLRDIAGGAANGLLVVAIAWADSVLSVFLTLFRIREDAKVFVAFSVARELMFMLMAIALVQAGLGITGGLIGRLVPGVVAVAAATAYVLRKRQISLRVEWRTLVKVIRYGTPILPANLAAYVLFASDRYFLEKFSGLQVVAIYSFAYKIASMLEALITRPFTADWAARRFKIAGESNPQKTYAQFFILYFYAAGGFGLILWAGAPLVYLLLAPSAYRIGITVVPLLLLSYLVFGLSNPLNVGIMLKDRTTSLTLIGVLTAALCIGLNLWWIPALGMLGAAMATLASYTVWTGSIAWVSLRLYPIKYPAGRLLAGSAAILVGGAFLFFLHQGWPGMAETSKAMIGLVGISALLSVLVYRERALVGSAMKSVAGRPK